MSIPAGFNVLHSTGDDAIKSLHSASQFTISHGSLTVGTAAAPGLVEVDNTFTLSGGTLADADVKPGSGGQGLTVPRSALDATLDGLTLNCDLDVAPAGYLRIRNGLTVNGIARLGDASYGAFLLGGKTLAGSGSVLFGGADSTSSPYGGILSQAVTIGPMLRVHGASGGIDSDPTSTIINQGTITADAALNLFDLGIKIGESGGAFSNQGTVAATGGGKLIIASPQFSVDGSGVIQSSPGSSITIDHNLLGNTTNSSDFAPLGTTTFFGAGAAATPQLLETMSSDRGAVAAGFSANFAYGSLALSSATYLKLVDQSHNSTGSGTEAVYADSLTIPTGAILDLNGLHVYVRSATVSGTVVGGSISMLGSDVTDPPLTAGAGLTIAATEGAAFSGTVAAFTDADPAGAVGDFSATVQWGDGASSTGEIVAAAGGGFSVAGSHVYAEEGQSLPVSVVIHDVGGAQTTATGTANVADAKLHLSAAAVRIPSNGAVDKQLVATFTDDGGAEPAANYAASIDWGDGGVSDGTVELSGGVFHVLGSHSYTAPGAHVVGVSVRDEGGSADALTEQATIPPTPHEQYVTAVYLDVLGRPADADGLAHWSQQLDAGAAVSDVAEAIAHSDEYYAAFVIQPAYLKLLGRAADADGIAYWTRQMRAGLTDQQLEAGFAASDEFYKKAGGADVPWTDAVYKLLLGRAADSDGEKYWSGQLSAGQTRLQVAEGIAGSAENNTQLINADYFHYLGRAADADGLAYWLGQFAAGTTNEDLIAGFTGADEYYCFASAERRVFLSYG